MRYLLSDGTRQERTHIVPAQSRLTVWANQEGGVMTAAEFATTVSSDQPIVAERAMYRDADGRMFAAGSVVSGVVAPETTWFLAEGATGAFFDTFLLLFNPGHAPSTVNVDFLSATARPVQRQYVVAPRTRRTVWVNQEDPALEDTQLAVHLEASSPIVAERSMWWPGPTSATWREVHAETGATTGGPMWGIADIQADADAGGWDTFLLVTISIGGYGAPTRVAVACSDGTRASRVIDISRRTTLWMRHEFPQVVGRRCAATVESLPRSISRHPAVALIRVPLVVEKAMYYGSDFVAGGVSLGTRMPNPE